MAPAEGLGAHLGKRRTLQSKDGASAEIRGESRIFRELVAKFGLGI